MYNTQFCNIVCEDPDSLASSFPLAIVSDHPIELDENFPVALVGTDIAKRFSDAYRVTLDSYENPNTKVAFFKNQNSSYLVEWYENMVNSAIPVQMVNSLEEFEEDSMILLHVRNYHSLDFVTIAGQCFTVSVESLKWVHSIANTSVKNDVANLLDTVRSKAKSGLLFCTNYRHLLELLLSVDVVSFRSLRPLSIYSLTSVVAANSNEHFDPLSSDVLSVSENAKLTHFKTLVYLLRRVFGDSEFVYDYTDLVRDLLIRETAELVQAGLSHIDYRLCHENVAACLSNSSSSQATKLLVDAAMRSHPHPISFEYTGAHYNTTGRIFGVGAVNPVQLDSVYALKSLIEYDSQLYLFDIVACEPSILMSAIGYEFDGKDFYEHISKLTGISRDIVKLLAMKTFYLRNDVSDKDTIKKIVESVLTEHQYDDIEQVTSKYLEVMMPIQIGIERFRQYVVSDFNEFGYCLTPPIDFRIVHGRRVYPKSVHSALNNVVQALAAATFNDSLLKLLNLQHVIGFKIVTQRFDGVLTKIPCMNDEAADKIVEEISLTLSRKGFFKVKASRIE